MASGESSTDFASGVFVDPTAFGAGRSHLLPTAAAVPILLLTD